MAKSKKKKGKGKGKPSTIKAVKGKRKRNDGAAVKIETEKKPSTPAKNVPAQAATTDPDAVTTATSTTTPPSQTQTVSSPAPIKEMTNNKKRKKIKIQKKEMKRLKMQQKRKLKKEAKRLKGENDDIAVTQEGGGGGSSSICEDVDMADALNSHNNDIDTDMSTKQPTPNTNSPPTSTILPSAQSIPIPLPPLPSPIPVPMPNSTSNTNTNTNNCVSSSSWGEAFQAAASITPQDLGEDYIDPATQEEYHLDKHGNVKVKWGSGNIKGVSDIALECIGMNDRLDGSSRLKKKRLLEDVIGDDVRDEVLVAVSPSSSSPPKKKKKKKEKKSTKKKTKLTKDNTDDITDSNDRDKGNNNDDDDDTHSPLEGQLITHNKESIMVLVDKTKKIVYSATQRTNESDDSHGDVNNRSHLVPIGIIDDEGNVRITADVTPDGNNDENNNDFPFSVDPDDHCESPLNAYQDIQPILDILVRILGKKTKEELSIYDPYYCNGSVVNHLKDLGYTNVYNKKEDCYATWSNTTTDTSTPTTSTMYPKYDVFMTNPPYSGDHVEKLIQHLTTDERARGKPWCLLMPTYVHKKDYYKEKIVSKKNPSEKGKIQPFYLVPKKRYVYLPPPKFRQKKLSDVHRKSSPFVSMWFVWGGTKECTDLLMKGYKQWEKKNHKSTCDLARTKSALRDLRRK